MGEHNADPRGRVFLRWNKWKVRGETARGFLRGCKVLAMKERPVPWNGRQLSDILRTLRREREAHKRQTKGQGIQRVNLSPAERRTVLAKTAGRCHICGGSIGGVPWQADHVLAHSGGGGHAVENYLPAHKMCNNYRWDYLAREFQFILKLGVWLRTHIEKRTTLGRQCAERFTAYESQRIRRRSSFATRKPTMRRAGTTRYRSFRRPLRRFCLRW